MLDDGEIGYDPDAWRRTIKLTQQTGREYSEGLLPGRLVIFVKQQSDFYYVGNSAMGPFEKYKIEFTINTESLLEHGFDVVQYWNPRWTASDGRTNDYGETNGRTLILLDDYMEWHCLKFKSSVNLAQDTDSFIIVLSAEGPASEGIPSVGITIPDDGDTSLPKPNINRKSSLDRTSKRMKSGRSVSVALRRRVGTLLRGWLYVVDITIDPNGNLPWPDLS
jgi:hypothetical protein